MKPSKNRGLTLIEIIVTMSIITLLALVGLQTLKPGVKSGRTRGLATSILNEFESARQGAIKSGQPTAVGIPTNGGANLAASSVYRLQGWNVPYVTQSANYVGDYPQGAFAAATWTGASTPANTLLPLPVSAKLFDFDIPELNAWLPAGTETDYIYCYLPDGSLITNNLPSTDGRYSLVVGTNPQFTGSSPSGVSVTGASEPFTILLSPSGGVEMVKGCPGGSIGLGGGAPAVAPPRARTNPPAPAAQTITLSEFNVAPNPGTTTNEGICIPGQFVTMEIFAYSPEGVPLFANWTHLPGNITGEYGTFTHPNGQGASGDLQGEADRMEYLSPAETKELMDSGVMRWATGYAPPPNTGVFRAQWSWTVPIGSLEFDQYQVTVNVQNAEADATINNGPPPMIPVRPAPKGRILVEKLSPSGIWQLYRMNPDGSGAVSTSGAGVEEYFPSVDANGNMMAFIQRSGGNTYVKTRPVEGGKETLIAGPGYFSSANISPDGNWVGYRNEGAGTVHATNVDSGVTYSFAQSWGGSLTHNPRKNRPGWSLNSQYMLFGNDTQVHCLDVVNGGAHNVVSQSVDTGGGAERVFAPFAYLKPPPLGAPAGTPGTECIMFSAGNTDPVLVSFEVDPAYYNTAAAYPGGNLASWTAHSPDLNGAGAGLGSGATDDDFPSISPGGGLLLITRSPQSGGGGEDLAAQRIEVFAFRGPTGTGPETYYGPVAQVIGGNVRRAIMLPAK